MPTTDPTIAPTSAINGAVWNILSRKMPTKSKIITGAARRNAVLTPMSIYARAGNLFFSSLFICQYSQQLLHLFYGMTWEICYTNMIVFSFAIAFGDHEMMFVE